MIQKKRPVSGNKPKSKAPKARAAAPKVASKAVQKAPPKSARPILVAAARKVAKPVKKLAPKARRRRGTKYGPLWRGNRRAQQV